MPPTEYRFTTAAATSDADGQLTSRGECAWPNRRDEIVPRQDYRVQGTGATSWSPAQPRCHPLWRIPGRRHRTRRGAVLHRPRLSAGLQPPLSTERRGAPRLHAACPACHHEFDLEPTEARPARPGAGELPLEELYQEVAYVALPLPGRSTISSPWSTAERHIWLREIAASFNADQRRPAGACLRPRLRRAISRNQMCRSPCSMARSVERPVEVVGDVGYLLVQLLQGVAQRPPGPGRPSPPSARE